MITYKVGNAHGLEPYTLRSEAAVLLALCLGPRRSTAYLLEAGLDHGLRPHDLAIRGEVVHEPARHRRGLLGFEQGRVDAHLGCGRALRHPLDIRLGLLSGFVEDGLDLRDLSRGGVCGERDRLDGVGHLQQTHGLARREAEIVLAVDLAEVGAVDVDPLRQPQPAGPHLGVLGREGDVEILLLGILDHDGHGVQDQHDARHRLLQVLSDGLLEARHLDEAVRRRDAELVDEGEERARRDAPSPDRLEGVQAGVVPAADDVVFDQAPYVPLAHDRALEIQAAELALHRLELNQKPDLISSRRGNHRERVGG